MTHPRHPTNTSMARLAQMAAKLYEVEADLVPGANAHSGMQLLVLMPNRVRLAVLPDSDDPDRYEFVCFDNQRLGGFAQLDKLTAEELLALLRANARQPGTMSPNKE